jgi:hypothetical protein
VLDCITYMVSARNYVASDMIAIVSNTCFVIKMPDDLTTSLTMVYHYAWMNVIVMMYITDIGVFYHHLVKLLYSFSLRILCQYNVVNRIPAIRVFIGIFY